MKGPIVCGQCFKLTPDSRRNVCEDCDQELCEDCFYEHGDSCKKTNLKIKTKTKS